MITSQIIENTLRRNYTPSIRSRGYGYYRKNLVEDMDVDIDQGWVWAEVNNPYGKTYEVNFEISGKPPILYGVCDCPYEDSCKHEVAVLYELEDWLAQHFPEQPQANKEKSKPKKEVPLNPFTATLDGKYSGEYRKLPLENQDLEEALRLYRPQHYRGLRWGESFEGKFLSDTELELKSIYQYSIYNFKEQKISIKMKDGDVLVKCHSCNIQTKHLCGHQMALLTYTQKVLLMHGILDGESGYQKIIDQGVEKTGVDKAVFHNYYSIFLKPEGIFISSDKSNIVDTSWMEKAQQVLDVKQEKRKKIIDRQISVLKEGRRRKYAFLWGAEHHGHPENLLHFIKGYSFKTKEGINTKNREILPTPDGFPEPIKKLGQALFFAYREEEPSARFAEIKSIIEDHLDTLNSFYQYVSTNWHHPLYHAPKASDLHLISFYPTPLQCVFKAYKKDGLVHIEYQVSLEGEAFDYSRVIYSNSVFCVAGTSAFLFPNYRLSAFLDLFNNQQTLILPASDQKLITQLLCGFQQYFEVDLAEGIIMEKETLREPNYQILLREVSQFVLFEPRLKYGEYSFNAFDAETYHLDQKVFRADENDRQFLINFLKSSHPDFDRPIQVQDYVYLDVKSMLNNFWFIHFNEACEAAGIEVLGQQELTKFKYSKYRATTRTHVRSGIDWFEVDMDLSFGKEKVKTADWIRAIRNKETFVTLKDGTLGILPEEWLKHAQKILAVADLQKNELKISKYRFNIIEDLFENIDDKKVLKELKAKKDRLAKIDVSKKHKIPDRVQADLREYQKHGFSWLKFLDESGFGGILADDMGLGKTLQVISLLADQIDQPPSLVVVPRSLLFNWAAELDKFCPDLQYVIHHGPGRSRSMEEILPVDLIISTYGTTASDVELFKDFCFNYIILDESQAIKNPNSKRYKAMRLLQSRNKIAMTGTPIENNTFDLYAQLSFTSPGLLGNQTHFKNNFAIPIDNNGDEAAANLLRKLIHPFLLRRTKEQVAKDLPDKTESIIYCEMGITQRKLYNNLKEKIKEDIEAVVEEKGIAQSKFQMLDGLLRLRQMCNSPLLLNPSFSGTNAKSVKIDILLQHIEEELGHHNALIFSQFVSLLSIVRRELDQRGIPYAYLDGATTKRQQQVEKFMTDNEIKIFLISLKAGNTGMNLTKADYVYLLDPWWNPAVETQAIDRTHRIGQDKHVFAYKLICKDTIEEKILKLQDKKKNLAKDIIRTDENVLKSLDKKELMALFD